jgi:hypothetical protein
METNGDCRQRGTVHIAMCEWDTPKGHSVQFCVRYVPSRQRSPNFQLLRRIASLALTLCGCTTFNSLKKICFVNA